ncbi:MAG: hypothetical protein CMO01_30480 [Thalassobius sp.]|nr:hypothetical protein [Thalassovita sp.]
MMIEQFIAQELQKVKAARHEIKNLVFQGEGVLQILPFQFVLVNFFQVQSAGASFQVQLYSDDNLIKYHQSNCQPIMDPYASRFFASSQLISIHRGYLESKNFDQADDFYLNYFLINTYDH